jgi:hypothetical protein
VIVKLPLALPVNVGQNCALKVLACHGFNVSGSVNALVLNALPVTLTWNQREDCGGKQEGRRTFPILVNDAQLMDELPRPLRPRARHDTSP